MYGWCNPGVYCKYWEDSSVFLNKDHLYPVTLPSIYPVTYLQAAAALHLLDLKSSFLN